MKKLFAVLAVVALAASFTSCKKDYTCTCTSNCYGYSSSASATAKLKKSDAKAWCEGNQGSSTGCTYSCSLD